MASLKESRYLNRTVASSILENRLLTVSVQPHLQRRGSFEIPSFIIKCHKSETKQKTAGTLKQLIRKQNKALDSKQQFGKYTFGFSFDVNKRNDNFLACDDIKCIKCKERLRKVDEIYNKCRQPKEQKYDKSCGPISLQRLIEYQAESVKSTYQSTVSVPMKKREDIQKLVERSAKRGRVKIEVERMEKKMERRIWEMSRAYRLEPPTAERKYQFSQWNHLKRRDGSEHMHCVEVAAGHLQLLKKDSLLKTGSKQLCQLFRSTRLAAWREVRFRQENLTFKFSEKSYMEFITRVSYLLSSGRRKHLLYQNIDSFENRMKFLGKIQLLSKIRRTETEKRMAIAKRTFPKYRVSRKRLTIRGSFVVSLNVSNAVKHKPSPVPSSSSSSSSFGKGGANRSRPMSWRQSESEEIVVQVETDKELSCMKDGDDGEKCEADAETTTWKGSGRADQSDEWDEAVCKTEETETMSTLSDEEVDVCDDEISSLASKVKDSVRDILSPHRKTSRSGLNTPRSPRDRKKSASCCSVL